VNISLLRCSGTFYVPEKLYGREEEIATLFDEFSAVFSRTKKKSIVLVSGVSGIGKTEVINEVSCERREGSKTEGRERIGREVEGKR
jgi:Cdc6-like AAA superfamily ATPase